jgi:hypothetical protein
VGWHRKTNTGEPLTVSVSYLSKARMLDSGYHGSLSWSRRGENIGSIGYACTGDEVQLSYTLTDSITQQQTKHAYSVQLSQSPCHFGGSRSWLVCPRVGCGRRVASLYMVGGLFWCRHCHQLGYESQQVCITDRHTLKADKIRDKLKWDAGILNGAGDKPKHMHRRTYWRLYSEHQRIVGGVFAAINKRFKLGLDDPLRFDP